MRPAATCQCCAWQGPVEQCGPLNNAWERVQAGDPVPAGECPKCHASALLDEPEPRMRIYTTREPACATHFSAYAHAQALMRLVWVAQRARG